MEADSINESIASDCKSIPIDSERDSVPDFDLYDVESVNSDAKKGDIPDAIRDTLDLSKEIHVCASDDVIDENHISKPTILKG